MFSGVKLNSDGQELFTHWAIFDLLTVGVCIVNPQQEIAFWNRTIENWSGINRRDILTKNLSSVFANLADPKYQKRIASVCQGGAPEVFSPQLHRYFFPFVMSDGRMRLQNTTITSTLMPGSEARCVVIVVEDVTELFGQMESYRRMRDYALQKQEQAEKIAIEKGAFLASMSHELRNPLNGVLGPIELLETTQLTNEQRQYVSIAKDSGALLLNLISDVLDLSKIEAGKFELAPLPTNTRECLRKITKPLEIQAQLKGIEFLLEIDPDIPEFLTLDSLRLGQVLINLVSNALKFTPKSGAIWVMVERTIVTARGVTLGIAVVDSGIGMSREALLKIFQPYTQATSEISRKFGGTGLGLTIVKRIVELMHGSISVESIQGTGSIFQLQIEASVPSQQEIDRCKSLYPAATNNSKPLNILLVDDNLVNQRVGSSMLVKDGHKVTVASNGEEALVRFKQEKFDLVLMDCLMPVMDGYAVAVEIRQDQRPEVQKIPIIALSGNSEKDEHERCVNSGMNAFLRKPYTKRELMEVIHRTINREAGGVNSTKQI